MAFITCGWCRTGYAAYRPECTNCGGPLPPGPGDDPGPPPPGAPREVPRTFSTRMIRGPYGIGLTWFAAGSVLGAVGLFTSTEDHMGLVLFCATAFLVGLAALAYAVWSSSRGQKLVEVFRVGEAAMGRIVKVQFLDQRDQINRHDPWQIDYSYTVDGRAYSGQIQVADESAAERHPGQPLHVLHDQRRPEIHTIYPPFRLSWLSGIPDDARPARPR